MKRLISILATMMLLMTMLPAALAESATSYIPAPYTIGEGQSVSDKILDPVFHVNENGPTIGVTLVGVVVEDGLYFRDANNNQALDVFEDWRLDSETRAADLVSRLTLQQQAALFFNNGFFSPQNTKTENVINENGEPVWDLIFPTKAGNNEIDITLLTERKIRAGVLRANPDTNVAVWFNNMLEQISEYDAIVSNEVALPFTIVSNPISTGYPGSLGVAAAAMGDNYDLVYSYADHDRQVMDAKGLEGLYGHQIDLVTDPRWSRNSSTYTERTDVMAMITTALVTGYQGGTNGAQAGDLALIMKHFPGDGAAQNGFESHSRIGKWRVYAVGNSLENYQLVGFKAAIAAGVSGIMPGYSSPTEDARTAKQVVNGVEINAPVAGNAFNYDITTGLLRDVLGFEGFINADSIMQSTLTGVEELSEPERLAIMIHAGIDAAAYLSDDPAPIIEAVNTGLLDKADLDRSSLKRLISVIELGNMENPYCDLEESNAIVDSLTGIIAEEAHQTNQKSVVLMKNEESVLPMIDTGLKVYVRTFSGGSTGGFGGAAAADPNEALVAQLTSRGFTVVDDYNEADVAYLVVSPSLSNRTNIAVLDLVDGVEVAEYNSDTGEKTGEMIEVTTVMDIAQLREIADAVHANGGKVVGNIKITNSWILTNFEPYCDALIGTFSTSEVATFDVLTGVFSPTGKLPVTMVSCNEVIAVNEVEIDGEVFDICVSPNDVPGYEKDQYIAAEVLAQSPSGSYAYMDTAGNLYSSGFGLSY